MLINIKKSVTQRRKVAKAQRKKESNESNAYGVPRKPATRAVPLISSHLLFSFSFFASLECQVKPGQSIRMKGVCHVNCSYDM